MEFPLTSRNASSMHQKQINCLTTKQQQQQQKKTLIIGTCMQTANCIHNTVLIGHIRTGIKIYCMVLINKQSILLPFSKKKDQIRKTTNRNTRRNKRWRVVTLRFSSMPVSLPIDTTLAFVTYLCIVLFIPLFTFPEMYNSLGIANHKSWIVPMTIDRRRKQM